MATALACSTTVAVSADDHETAFDAQTRPAAKKGLQPSDGLLALSEIPAGVMAVTTVSGLLSRIIPGSTRVCFGDCLRDLCGGLAATCGRSGSPKLTCAAADATLPIGAVITLGLIADLLITNAFVYAFPTGRGGRIAVSFTAGQEAWQLTVEDSGTAVQGRGDRRDPGLTIARLLVLLLDGQLELPRVTGGTRCIVSIPRPAART